LIDDNNHELSSPIHRTEEKFTAEESSDDGKSVKRGARLDRLAALASTINNWEDDLSHPIITSSKVFCNTWLTSFFFFFLHYVLWVTSLSYACGAHADYSIATSIWDIQF